MFADNYIVNWDEVRRHVLSSFPNEAGGYVRADNVFVPADNIADNPENTFEMDAGVLIGEDVKCILHSHPYDAKDKDALDPRIPSIQDMQCQQDMDVEWAIVCTDGVNVSEPVFWGDYEHRPPLMKREFILNVQDCGTFFTDWYYKNFKIAFPIVPRNAWDDPDMVKYALEWGFREVTDVPQERGDLCFFNMDGPNINHMGVLVEPNLVAHHTNGRFPRQQPLAVFAKYRNSKRFRYKTNPGAQ